MNKFCFVTWLGLTLLFSCKSTQMAMSELPPLPAFDTEAHRGGRGLMPENTVPAMLHALDLGITTLEMDCHITQDNKVVLTHDDYINPSFSFTPEGTEIPQEDAKKYAIYKMPYEQVKKFDVGSKVNDKFPQQKKLKTYIPQLDEVIEEVQGYLKAKNKPQVFYNIETKSKPAGDNQLHPDPETFVRLLMEVIESKKINPWVIIQSFDPRTLRVMHQKYPKVRTSLLVENQDGFEVNIQRLGYTPEVYSPNSKLVTTELVKQCHDRNMKIIPWTVNTTEEINQLKALGVDGIISDYPQLLTQNK